MVKNVSVVVLNRFRRTGTPHSLIFGGFWFRVTALRTDGQSDGRTDGWSDGRTDGWSDGRTDRPSYRDARTHLKRSVSKCSIYFFSLCRFSKKKYAFIICK